MPPLKRGFYMSYNTLASQQGETISSSETEHGYQLVHIAIAEEGEMLVGGQGEKEDGHPV